MFIILEGPDGSGKSTLQHAIAHRLRSKTTQHDTPRVGVMHCGQPEEKTREWVLDQYVHSVSDYHPRENHHIVADRWHFGEAVYAPIYRPETDRDGFGLLGEAGWRWVELFLLARGARVVPVQQSLDVLEQRLGIRGDDFVRHEHLASIVTNYGRAYSQSPTTVAFTVSPTDEQSTHAAIDQIVSAATAAETLAAMPTSGEARPCVSHLYSYYVGSPHPRVLLVGDSPNETGPRGALGQGKPFYPIASNSSEFLLTALPDDTWTEVGLINSDRLMRCHPENFVQQLGNPHVIALGTVAALALERSGASIPFATLPHPQYTRRFHYSRKQEYGLAIQAAMSSETPVTGDLWTR